MEVVNKVSSWVFSFYFILIGLWITRTIGLLEIFLVGLPLLILAWLLRKNSLLSNEKYNETVLAGQLLTKKIEESEIIDLFFEKLLDIAQIDSAYLLKLDRDQVFLLRKVDYESLSPDFRTYIQNYEFVAPILRKNIILTQSKKEWERATNIKLPTCVKSVVSVPVISSNEFQGLLLLATSKKRAYSKAQLKRMNLFCCFLANALANAKKFNEIRKESEICALTNIYNYRYFSNCLYSNFANLKKGKLTKLSLIMLDIDHFKKINDTYGHQAGDEVLIKIAERLQKLVGDRGVLARYGGEEFTILLPETNQEEAHQFAENVRKAIANNSFSVRNELDTLRPLSKITVTASIGISTAPDEAQDPTSLIRYADRALYTGAKRAGRNKVAEYFSCR